MDSKICSVLNEYSVKSILVWLLRLMNRQTSKMTFKTGLLIDEILASVRISVLSECRRCLPWEGVQWGSCTQTCQIRLESCGGWRQQLISCVRISGPIWSTSLEKLTTQLRVDVLSFHRLSRTIFPFYLIHTLNCSICKATVDSGVD